MSDIILNPNSDKLNCNRVDSYKVRCIVPKSHFDGIEDGYYPMQYFKYLNGLTIFYELSYIQVILPKQNDVIIFFKKEENVNNIIKIGQKGIFYLITDFYDENNIFNDTYIPFDSTIKDENENENEYNVNCKLWKPKDENLTIICKLKENLKYSRQNIALNKVEFTYNNYNIIIPKQDPFKVEQLNYDISFLYSDEQNIKIEEGIGSYNVKFIIESYNNERLYMYGEGSNSIILDGCERNENELNCKISKEKLEEVLIKNNEQFKIGAINDAIGIINFDSILKITITYEIDKKEDIYVKITNLLTEYSPEGIPIAFETNVTNIPNIITDIFNLCYFKKNNLSNLLYLCNFNREKWEYKINDIINMSNSHYKYNFIILPSDKTYYFNINNFGANIKLIYPEILDFTSEQSLTISFLTSNPSSIDNLKFVPDSDYLNCEVLNGIKKCIVPFIHFIGQKNNNYYYLNQTIKNEPSSFVHYESSPIKVILPENIIEIYVNDEDNKNYYGNPLMIGKNNFLNLITNYADENNIFDISDIEEKTHFNTTIYSYNYFKEIFVKVMCRLWKPKNDKIRILCKLNEDIGINSIKLNSVSFNYKKYRIAIISTMSFKIDTKKTNKNILILYSDKQEINIEENKQYYDLKFKIEEYNNEELILLEYKPEIRDEFYFSEFILDNCTTEGKVLTCTIEKEKIIEGLYYSGEIFSLNFYSLEKEQPYKLFDVLDIKINYNISQKEDIFVRVTKLLQTNLSSYNIIPYETNISSISNVQTDIFLYTKVNNVFMCRFKKTTNKPLLFLCFLMNHGTYSSLGEINSEVILNDVHAKYNFRIQPVNNSEEYTIKNDGSFVFIKYPTKLDFTKNDLIPINLIMMHPENTGGIRLNPDSGELVCGNLDNSLKRCLVPKSHFDGKKNGYFYIYYLNKENQLNIFYEVSPILVTLQKEDDSKSDESKPDDSKKNLVGIIVGSVVGGLVLIGIIVFFVVRHIKRKNAAENDFSGKNKSMLSDSNNV